MNDLFIYLFRPVPISDRYQCSEREHGLPRNHINFFSCVSARNVLLLKLFNNHRDILLGKFSDEFSNSRKKNFKLELLQSLKFFILLLALQHFGELSGALNWGSQNA